jgi:hypothetical protein
VAYDEDLANRIRELIAGDPDVTEKKMFGGLAFLVGGNMSIAASGEGGLMVRGDPQDVGALLTKPHARPSRCAGASFKAGCESTLRACEPSASSIRGSDAASRTPALFLPSAEIVRRHRHRLGTDLD